MGPILCGTDFSDWGSEAQAVAAVLAGRLHRPLLLVHVVEPDVEALGPEAKSQAIGVLRARLEREGRTLAATATFPVATELMMGKPEVSLKELAASKKASLVVVGSAGHSTTALARLGGTSERLATANEVPVLVVRDDGPFMGWSAGSPLKVLVGIDDSGTASAAVRWVEQLREVAPVDVVVGQVYYADEAHERYGLKRRLTFTEVDPALEGLIERDLKRRVPSLGGQGEVFYRAKLGMGRVADHLLELAEAEGCQLLAVGTHRRTGLARMWSVSAAALHLSRMAVVVVPSDGQGFSVAVPAPALRRILVATDFSALGNAAVPWAATLAGGGAELFLCHVAITDALTGDVLAAQGRPWAELEAELTVRLLGLVPAELKGRGVMVHTEVARADQPARAITEAAARLGADVVVIASHGRSGVARTLLGSVAEEVLRTSHKPVFVVRS